MVSRTVATLFSEAEVKSLNEEAEGIKKLEFRSKSKSPRDHVS